MLVLYDTFLDEGIKHANKILEVLHSVQFTYRTEKIKVTLSGSVCSRSNSNAQNMLVKKLQNLLKKAKTNGRNRIEICPLKEKQSL